MSEARPIKIAIMALGGQGGGVLSDWIVKLGERAGYLAQSTSVPGVAQRTGATIYYVELFPEEAAKEKGKSPVLALMPAPGDVDVVIAAELMEAGRAIMRGLVTKQTLLIASSHRDFAIAEKIAMSDGRQSAGAITEAAKKSAGRFVLSDFAGAAASENANISAALFGALCGSGAVPAPRIAYEDAIREGGRAVDNNLKAFEKGLRIVSEGAVEAKEEKPASIQGNASPKVAPLLARMEEKYPPAMHDVIREGLKRTVDFQDVRYAHLYLERLDEVFALDTEAQQWRLTKLTAKHLALWMTFEDAIRVADLKTRGSRFERFREDVKAAPGQIVQVSEYLHPRIEEICDLLPTWMALFILKSSARRKFAGALIGGGRRMPTTKLRGFLPLYILASFKWSRRGSYRFKLEQARISEWLFRIRDVATGDYDLACEIAALQKLIKGYGDTHERGLGNFQRILAELDAVKRQDNPAETLQSLCKAAFADEEGVALRAALRKLDNVNRQPEAVSAAAS